MTKKERNISLAFEDNLKRRLYIARFGDESNHKAMKEELDLIIDEAIDNYKNSDETARWIENKISEAIAEHEARQWKKYPDERPEKGQILVETKYGFFKADVNTSYLDDVIRWRELPTPYKEDKKEGGEG